MSQQHSRALTTWARGRRGLAVIVSAIIVAVVLVLSFADFDGSATASNSGTTPSASSSPAAHKPVPWQFRNPLPGMPPVIGGNVYSQTHAGMVLPKVAHDPAYVYVPDSDGDTVTVISQKTKKIVRIFHTGFMTQHVVPSYNMRTLYATASVANHLVRIDPRTGKRGKAIPVPRPYNLYFSPDGKQAIVMVKQHDVIRFSDPQTFHKIADVQSPACQGPDHSDFSANGRSMVVTCEFSGELLRVNTVTHKITGKLKLATKRDRPARVQGGAARREQAAGRPALP